MIPNILFNTSIMCIMKLNDKNYIVTRRWTRKKKVRKEEECQNKIVEMPWLILYMYQNEEVNKWN